MTCQYLEIVRHNALKDRHTKEVLKCNSLGKDHKTQIKVLRYEMTKSDPNKCQQNYKEHKFSELNTFTLPHTSKPEVKQVNV